MHCMVCVLNHLRVAIACRKDVLLACTSVAPPA